MRGILAFARKNFDIVLLIGIVCFAIWLRLATANVDIILDYDPWFWYRQAEGILKNNFLPLKWDILSYFPPGRPTGSKYQLGWSYTLASSYVLTKAFLSNLTFMKFSIYFIAFFSGLCAVPAYLVGRTVTNKWGGLMTAFFAVVTPTFLGVSMAGYPDSDAVDVFYTFLVILTTLYAIKSFSGLKSKKTWFSIALALASYWLFAFNWNTSWYVFYIFVGFIPLYIVFKIVESLIQRQETINLGNLIVTKIKESKNLVLVIVLIGILGEALAFLTYGWPFSTIPPIEQLINGLQFLTGKALIVNISVAELQPINVFSKDGFLSITSRIGIFPVILAIIGLPLIVVYKLFYKKKITTAEYFAIIWMIISFWLITRGIRFSLLFSMAVATASGFVVGSLTEFLKQRKDMLILSAIYGFILFGLLWHVSDNMLVSQQAGGMEVSQNWRDALDWLKTNSDENTLITTWWDPGHIIAGYAGLKVMADGAHCDDACYPYNHNIRIQDMGRVFSIGNETEAVNILQKYTGLTQQQCQELKQKFGDAVPSEACNKVSQMYVIASYDLIGKYYWLSYFGTGTGRNYLTYGFKNYDQTQGIVTYCIVTDQLRCDISTISLAQKNNKTVAIINIPQQGVTNAIARDITLFNQGSAVNQRLNETNAIDGLVWINPDFSYLYFMDSSIRNSVFTNMFFFDGEGIGEFGINKLTSFTKVFENSEVKIFKVNF
jgi:dolichyl-diphosphooligosaccharide--protein glycosyltransferase